MSLPVTMRLELEPRSPLLLPGGGVDGVLRRHGGVLERLLHTDGEPVLVRAAYAGSRSAVLFGARAPTQRLRGGARADALRVRDRRRSERLSPPLQPDDPLIGRTLRAMPGLRPPRRRRSVRGPRLGDLRAADRVRAGGGDRAADHRAPRPPRGPGAHCATSRRPKRSPPPPPRCSSPSISPVAARSRCGPFRARVAGGRVDLARARARAGLASACARSRRSARGRSSRSRSTARAATTRCRQGISDCASSSDAGSAAATRGPARKSTRCARFSPAMRSGQGWPRCTFRAYSPWPGRNSLVNGGRPVSGSCWSSPCENIQLPKAAHAEGSCQPNGLPPAGCAAGSVCSIDSSCSFGFQRRVGLDDERGRGGRVGAHLALAARERLQERAQVLAAGVRLVFAHDQHELVVGGHAGPVDGDHRRVLVHQCELDAPRSSRSRRASRRPCRRASPGRG